MKRQQEENNRKKYTVPNGSPYQYRARNAVFISSSNTLKHEMAKSLGAYLLHKFGDVKFDERIIGLLAKLQTIVGEVYQDWPKNPTDFITEAVPKSNKDRRIDLVELKSETWFEFETQKIDKGDCITIKI